MQQLSHHEHAASCCLVVHWRLSDAVLQFSLYKLPKDLPRNPWKVPKVDQKAPVHRGRTDGRNRGGERRAALAAGRARLSGRPDGKAERRGRGCRWGPPCPFEPGPRLVSKMGYCMHVFPGEEQLDASADKDASGAEMQDNWRTRILPCFHGYRECPTLGKRASIALTGRWLDVYRDSGQWSITDSQTPAHGPGARGVLLPTFAMARSAADVSSCPHIKIPTNLQNQRGGNVCGSGSKPLQSRFPHFHQIWTLSWYLARVPYADHWGS